MRTKPDVAIGFEQAPASGVIHTLLAELTKDELERVAVTLVREHRTRLNTAQNLFEEIGRSEAAGTEGLDLERLQHDYHIAMLNLHAQHQLVSLAIDKLGYVPMVDGQRPMLN